MFNRFFKIFLVSVFIIITISCDIFISNPGSRENPTDPNAYISNFTAHPVGTDRIITTWDRNNFVNEDQEIDEIRVVHSTLGYPVALIPFIGDSIVNSEILRSDWTNLDPDITHYFALYMKDSNGNWLSPIYTKATLPGGAFTSEHRSILNAWHIWHNDQPHLNVVDSDNLTNIDNEAAVVIELDLPANVTIISAVINPLDSMGLYTESPGSFNIVALNNPLSNLYPYTASNELYNRDSPEYLVIDKSGIVVFGKDLTWNTAPIDITKAVQAAFLSGSNQLVLGYSNIQIPVKLHFKDFIEIEYITN